MNVVIMPDRTVFIADTYVNADPTAEQVAETALLAAEEIRRFGIVPRVALLSHSSFGSSSHPQAQKMRAALALINTMEPDLEVEGEMHGDAALSAEVRHAIFPESRLKGDANLLLMPTLDAANISFNLLKIAAGSGLTLGPILLGVAKPVHILTPLATCPSHRQHDGPGRRRRQRRATARPAVGSARRNPYSYLCCCRNCRRHAGGARPAAALRPVGLFGCPARFLLRRGLRLHRTPHFAQAIQRGKGPCPASAHAKPWHNRS